MENLHLKNLKDNNLEAIKQSSWFKEFTEEQQYYIESGIKNNIDITKFAKKEFNGNEMFDILTKLEMKKYDKTLTIPYYIYKFNDKMIKKYIFNTEHGIDKI